MEIVADESVDYFIIKKLRDNNINVISILERYPSISDDEVLDIAFKNKSLILTEDKDFGELTIRFKKKCYGVILLRLAGVERSRKQEIVNKLLRNHFGELKNRFTVITEYKIRMKILD